LIENSRNHGFTYAVNQGIAASHAESDIFLLNNDAVLRPHALIALQDAAYRLKDAGIVVPRQILPAQTKSIKAHVPWASDLRECDINLSKIYRNIEKLPVFHDGGPIEVIWAPFFAAYVRRDVIDKMGLLDVEHGRHHLSDRLYCEKMRLLMGRKVYYEPDASVDHLGQLATKILAADAARSEEADLLLTTNSWDAETRSELGYTKRAWDI
jgi:GT2 family glycosyltransferase